MKNLIRHIALATAAGLLCAGSVATAANAEPDPAPEIIDALAITSTAAAAPDVLADRAEIRSAAEGYVSETTDTTITLPQSADAPVTLDSAAGEISVSIPSGDANADELGKGPVSYDAGDGSTTVPVPKEDGSVQFVSIIDRLSNPTEYRYNFDLPAGAYLEAVADGGVAVKDGDGAVLYGVLAPWAVDANGDAVPTVYEIDGSSIVQHVNHNAGDAYPVIADPWLGGTWVSSWSWYTGITRIALYPTAFAQWACPGNITCAAAWQGAAQSELANEQLSTTNKNKIWKSTTRNQIGCHMVAGPLKSPWNLETNVADHGLSGFISRGCNP